MLAFAIVCIITGVVLLVLGSPRGGDVEVGHSDISLKLPQVTGLPGKLLFILGIICLIIGISIGLLRFIQSLNELSEETQIGIVQPSPTIVSQTATDTPTPTQGSLPTDTPIPTSTTEPTPPAAPTLASQYQGWIICWHGRADHEFLIAYPESEALTGIDLAPLPFKHPWNSGVEDDLLNDSMKTCLYNDIWYGNAVSMLWFPKVSHLRLSNNQLVICDHLKCEGEEKWTLEQSDAPPIEVVNLLRQPSNRLEILGYILTEALPK